MLRLATALALGVLLGCGASHDGGAADPPQVGSGARGGSTGAGAGTGGEASGAGGRNGAGGASGTGTAALDGGPPNTATLEPVPDPQVASAPRWTNPTPVGPELQQSTATASCRLTCQTAADCCILPTTREKLQTACRQQCGRNEACCAVLAAREGCPGEFPARLVCSDGACQYRGCRDDSECQRYFGPDYVCELYDTPILGEPFGQCAGPCPTSGTCPNGSPCDTGSCGVGLPDPGSAPRGGDPGTFLRCQSSDECVNAITMPEAFPADTNVVGPYCKQWGSYSSCVECRTNEDCVHSPHGPRCNVATGFCACCDDAECPDPYVCPQGSFACE